MEISDVLKSIIINTLKQSWYIWFILILIIILATVAKIFIPRINKKIDKKVSGIVGEKIVASILSRLDREKYKIINNLIIYIDKGATQIDHLVISNYGIFVIETKNYQGIILGEENSNYWTQILYKNRENFYNPIRQNNWHIQVLENILKEYLDIVYFPIVVFIKNSDLRVKTVTDVVNTDDLIKTIRQHRTEIISDIVREDIHTYLKNIKFKTN